MKSILLLSFVAVLLAGCHSTYVITLHSGAKIYSASKPQLTGGLYVYKDANGRVVQINSSKVESIEPK